MSKRNALRSAILGSTPAFRKEIVTFEGNEYEVRQTTRKIRGELFKKCTKENGQMDALEMLLWGAIFCTFEPGSNERVFEEADYAVLSEQPTGGIVDKLGKVAMELLNVEDESIEKK